MYRLFILDGVKFMKVISWNISYLKANDVKLKYLLSLLKNEEFVAVLQEVTQKAYQELEVIFHGYPKEYSLEYRPMGKYDTKSRGLGIAIITSKNIKIIKTNVLHRALLPERTLLVKCSLDDCQFSVLGLHSITGCDHKKAKSLQFYSFAEEIDIHRPDIVCIDANEPEIDNISVSSMKFFDNKDRGKGAKTFFETMTDCGLADAYSNINRNENSLPFSHIVAGKHKKRYDFVFIKRNIFEISNMIYDYDNGLSNGSDHAILITDICHP